MKFKLGDRVKIDFDFEEAILESIDYEDERPYLEDHDVVEIFEGMAKLLTFTIDRCDLAAFGGCERLAGKIDGPNHHVKYEYYWLKELPNIRFSKWELRGRNKMKMVTDRDFKCKHKGLQKAFDESQEALDVCNRWIELFESIEKGKIKGMTTDDFLVLLRDK